MATDPLRDPVSLVESVQAELAELRLALIEPGPLSMGGHAIAVQHVQTVAAALGNLKRTLHHSPTGEAAHG